MSGPIPDARRSQARRTHGVLACLLLAGLLWALATPALAQKGRWEPDDSVAPALVLPAVTEESVDLAAYRGRVVIVNFWATWCSPCIAEMPSLQALASKFGINKVVLLGVNFHESAQKIRDFEARYKLGFPLLRDPWQEASAAWKVRVLPTTFIIDAQGKVRWRVVGEVDWSTREVEQRLRALVDSGSARR